MDPKEQADNLYRHFQLVFKNGTTYSDEEFSKECQMPPCDFPVLDKIDISERGVMKLLCNLTPGKPPDPDNITPRVLKELASEIAPSLTIIFQYSLVSGKLPSDWKAAHVTPIFKKGEQYDPGTCVTDKCLL